MNRLSTYILFTALLTLTGCNSMKVSTDHEKGYNFSALKTYQWIDAPEEILSNPSTYLHPAIPAAISKELAIKGMAEAQNPDVHLVYYVKLNSERGYTSAADHGDGHDFSGGFTFNKENKWQYTQREPDLNTYEWEVGTLTVLMLEASTGKRLWRGTLKTEIDRHQSEEKQVQAINEVAKKLMSHYPPLR